MKKGLAAGILFLFVLSAGFAEQITTVGIVDLSKVINAFYKESSAVREYEKMKESFRADIEKQNEEIRQLSERKLNAENSGDRDAVLRLDNEIFQKKEYLREYIRIKNAQLESKRNTLSESSSFLKEVLEAVESVSLNEGYSVVLNSSDPNLIWYSNIVDITDKVIQHLTKASR